MTFAFIVRVVLVVLYGFGCFYVGFREGWDARGGERKDW